MRYHKVVRETMTIAKAYQKADELIVGLIDGLESWLDNVEDTNLKYANKIHRIKALVNVLTDIHEDLPICVGKGSEWNLPCTIEVYKHRNKKQPPTRKARATMASNALYAVAHTLRVYKDYQQTCVDIRQQAKLLSVLVFPRMYG